MFLSMCAVSVCRDEVLNNFVSRSRHLFVPLLFHEVTPLPPLFRRNGFPTFLIHSSVCNFIGQTSSGEGGEVFLQ